MQRDAEFLRWDVRCGLDHVTLNLRVLPLLPQLGDRCAGWACLHGAPACRLTLNSLSLRKDDPVRVKVGAG